MLNWNDPESLAMRLEMILGHLEAEMPKLPLTISLVLRLEATLQRLGTQNFEPPGSCCGCLQNLSVVEHLPNWPIALDLQAIKMWKQTIISFEFSRNL